MTKMKNMQKSKSRIEHKKQYTDQAFFTKLKKKMETEIFAFCVIPFEPIKI